MSVSVNIWFILELDLIDFCLCSSYIREFGIVFQALWTLCCADSGFCHFSLMSVVSFVLADDLLVCAWTADSLGGCRSGFSSDSLSVARLLWVCSMHMLFWGQRWGQTELRIHSLAAEVVWLQALELQLQTPVDVGPSNLFYIVRAKNLKCSLGNHTPYRIKI